MVMAHTLRGRVLPFVSAVSIAVGSFVAVAHLGAAATGNITEYSIPTSGAQPRDIATGPDHNLWFTELASNKIGKLTRDGLFTEYPTPTTGSFPCGITSGPDGNLWFTESATGKIGRLTPSGTFTEFSLSSSNSAPCAITSGPDGNLWFAENSGSAIGRIATDGTISYFPTLGAAAFGGITSGPDGNLWATENTPFQGAKIDRVSTGGSFTQFTVGNPLLQMLGGIAAGPDGNLWFTQASLNAIGRITTLGTITSFAVPQGGEPALITAGADGNMWFTEITGDRIGQITVGGTITEYPLPTASSQPIGIAAGADGNIWFTESAGNKIGRLEIAPTVVLPAMANAAYGGYTTVAEIENTGNGPAAASIQYFDSNGNAVGSGDFIASLAAHTTWTVRQDDGHAFAAGQAGSAKVYSTQPIASFVNEFAPTAGADATSYTGIDGSTGTGTILYAPTIVNNAYGGYTTGIGLINAGTSNTNITITYRDATGTAVKAQSLSAIPPGAYQGLFSGDPTLGLPDGFAGTATIVSSAGPLAAIVNETGPGGQFSSYDAVSGGNTTLYAPAALDNAYGGFNTGMAIQNTTATAATVTINYYDSSGTATTHTFVVAANGYLGVYQGTDLTVAGAYTARITSNGAVAAIVNETAPSATSAKQSTSYNTFATGLTTAHLALVENAGSDGWSTGEGIMNVGLLQASVKVNYFDANTGLPIGTQQNIVLAPNAYWGVYQPTGGLPAGDRATANVTIGPGGVVAVITNESNSTSFMSYNGQ